MAWGIFKKIGQGLKKAFNFVKDKIVKPVAKFVAPVAKAAAPVISTFAPGVGAAIGVGADVVSKLAGNSIPQKMVGRNGHGIRKRTDQIMSPYIQLQE